MTVIRYTPSATLQLIEIWSYSVRRWGDERADRYLRAIDEAIRAVASGKRRARARPDLFPGVHVIRAGSHNIYLRFDAEEGVLQIVAVLHQRMEPSRHLARDE